MLKRDADAIKAFQAIPPGEEDVDFEQGYAHFYLQQYDKAVAPLKKAVGIKGDLVAVLQGGYYLAIAFQKLDKNGKAVEVFRHLIKRLIVAKTT